MAATGENGEKHGLLGFWPKGEVWFRRFLRDDVPWSTVEALDPVPEGGRDEYGVLLAGPAKVEGTLYREGEFVALLDRSSLERFVAESGRAGGLAVPWFDRIVPDALWAPRTEPVALGPYRKEIGARFTRSLLVTIAGVAAFRLYPEFGIFALLLAAYYGLFPLVESAMAWMRRVDLLSVEELNRRLVNAVLFSRWMQTRPSIHLKIGVAVLAVVFVGQMLCPPRGVGTSIEAAALVKERVSAGGEWWRVVTAGLMHGSVLHILFNGMALLSFGRVLAALVSRSLLPVVFLLAVVAGSLASLWFGPGERSVGASGGILGCLGFLLVVSLKFKEVLPGYLQAALIQSAIVIALFGAIGSSFIDNAAHAGGLIGGALLAVALWPWLRLAPEKERPAAKIAGLASLGVLLAGVAKIAAELFFSS